jgi:hypothetical protein
MKAIMPKPTPQTKETIESELRAGEREKVLERARSVIRELDECEARLEALEKEAGLPSFYRSKTLTNRMAQLGMSHEAIDEVAGLLDAIEKLALGRCDELSEAAKKMLAREAQAELSAADQLATIIKAAGNRARNPPPRA